MMTLLIQKKKNKGWHYEWGGKACTAKGASSNYPIEICHEGAGGILT